MAKRSRVPTNTAAAAAAAKRARLSRPSVLSQRSLSPQETLGAAVSQATTFESQFFESQTEEEGAAEGSQAGTAATTEASVDTEPDNGDNFDGINWDRLPRFMKPLTTGRRVKSWIFQHGYRVVELYDQNRVWFVCKYCHIHKVIDTGGSGVFDVSKATSSAAAHLGLQKRGHGFTKDGLKPRRTGQQLSLRQTLETGVAVSQEAANAMGNFNIQQFREVAVFCLLDNNLPMELLARPSFREMISLANPEAEAALWVSPRSVATYAMRLFQYMQPQIVCALSEAASKIHISFDGWTTKGGKRGFFGVVAHFANASGVIQDLPIALPHLAGSHTGDAIADTIKKTLQEYSIGSDKLGYFVLDNAANNDTAVSSLAHAYDFNAAHRRLRCGPHTLNLIGQAIIFGSNQEAYNNNNDEQLQTEEVYMQEWRQEGPLGVLIDVINHIKTPQQHEIFRSFQTAANAELPARERLHVLEPVKPVVTRWNSYYAAFKRATQLQAAYNSYAEHYINALSLEDRRACQRGNKLPEAPSWMRSTGLTAADWAVITEYQDCLEPLKLATEKLEGRGKAGKYGAIYETIPVFEYVLGALEARTRSYEQVDFNPPDAPEDHLFVNLRAAWSKANDYYNKLDRSPAYYAATCLHPYYKYYCENSWSGFLQLWQSYKPQRTRPLSQTTAKPRHRGIDDVIGALVRRNKAQVEAAHDDEYERWRTQEPEWTSEQYLSDGHPVKYWIQLRSKYPCLSQFTIDILTIPASSCDCERLFSELGDLLEPRRRALGSELLAALQLVRSWRRAGFDGLYNNGDDEDKWSDVKDEEIVQQYDIEGWRTLQDHRQKVGKVLQRLMDAGLQIDIDKCEFETKRVKYLGYIVEAEVGIQVDPEKVVAIREWATPTTVKAVRAFIGFANFYRVFIPEFSDLAQPLINLTKKEAVFHWDAACDQAFESIRELLVTAPILGHFDPERETLVEADSSGYATGGLLLQKDKDNNWQPVAYYSKKHSATEANYPIHDKELLAIVRCLEAWAPELHMVKKFTVLTDHKNLQYFYRERQLSERQVRWSELISRFNFALEWKPGKTMGKPDALSRREQDLPTGYDDERLRSRFIRLFQSKHLRSIQIQPLSATTEIDFTKNIRLFEDQNMQNLWHKGRQEDTLYQELTTLVANKERNLPTILQKEKAVSIAECTLDERGLLRFRDRIWIPDCEPLRTQIIQNIHDSHITGHPGRDLTYTILSRQFFWSGAASDVRRFVRNCEICGRNTIWRDTKRGLLKPLPIPERIWGEISIDFITDLPPSGRDNATNCMVVTDRLTKGVELEGLHDISAEAVAQRLFERHYPIHGIPTAITSDRGPQFVCDLWRHFCKLLDIEQRLSTAYHPQTDGATERMNQEIEKMIRIWATYTQENWLALLPIVIGAINNREASSTSTVRNNQLSGS
ncbi:Dimer-Tnp-hAT dimerization containing protein [Pyrenophora tritici-repentis]|uniref:Dimer-Tnp-hAT dimerization containing protein n=1 Tax=Pyrenophora tritici-repentis TaxID=45151 RepID=A0A922MZS8_9PLEO|nr:Dimer-Tnp-hAT dimerization containing protein [Pyrenophora tritici-repentis]